MKQISIIGLGYIGLPTALIAAKHGNIVHGFDIDETKVASINAGEAPIVEPGIQELLSRALSTNRFRASTSLVSADYFVIAVPTPFHKTDKKANLSYVMQAGAALCDVLKPGNTIILESTVPVGATQVLARLIEETSGLRASKDFYLAYCPERVLPGKIIHELIQNDRIIGGICEVSARKAQSFYNTFVTGTCYRTNDKTAEMVKLIENSSRDIQIALANQIAAMSTKAGINPFEVIELANKHPRVQLLQPGCGVGGHCIAVDPWFLIEGFPQETQLLKAAREINDQRPHEVVKETLAQARHFYKRHNKKPHVLALGLTFKPDIDDMRESPALFIAQALNEEKEALTLTAYEPFVPETALAKLRISTASDLMLAIKHTDIVLVLVKHTQFKIIDLKKIHNKIIIDPVGLSGEIPSKGFYEATVHKKGASKGARCPDTKA